MMREPDLREVPDERRRSIHGEEMTVERSWAQVKEEVGNFEVGNKIMLLQYVFS